MEKWRYVHSIILSLLVLLLASCSNNNARKYVIGVSQCSDDIWRDKLNTELKMGEYLNDSLTVRLASSNDDSKRQIEQINDFIDEGVNLLIISPNQLNTISSAINRAYEKGIPVILFDRKSSSQNYTAFIGSDNFSIGKMMGSFIAQRLHGKGRVVEIQGLEGSSPAIDRHRGFMVALKDYPGIQVVASESGDWKGDSGEKAMRRILAKVQDFDYVFSHNDRMAAGAIKAAHALVPSRIYKYTGVDALASQGGGLDMVRDGVMESTCLYPTKGDEVIALAMNILQHRPYQRDNYLHTSVITKENAQLTLMQEQDAERQKANLSMLHERVGQYLSQYHSQRVLLAILVVFLLVVVVASALVFRGYVIKVKLNEELSRRNEEQEKMNAELKRLNEEVMELTHSRLVFFTNISHELRTPLTLIADPVEMLLEDEKIKGKSREMLKMVQRNAIALQQLVGSILDFRKIQNGKMELKLCRFDIVKALTMWTGDFQLTAERKQIQLHLEVEGFSGSHEVVADKEKVARIVFNLLSNALKYTPSGGDIYVSLRDAAAPDATALDATALGLASVDKLMRIDVRDTGKGIAKEEAQKVFERFFQAKGAASGTGIGLALVKSFVDLHHGIAKVESEVGKGSDFIVILPRLQEADGKVIHDDDESVDNSVNDLESENKKIINENVLQYIDDGNKHGGKLQQVISADNKSTLLIIDDNNDIRQYERTLLQDEYFILEASDGKEGLEIAKKEVPDLVVCDVMMPVMDGLEFTEQLKTNTATSHIPVIMLTAKNLEEQRAEGYEHGADSYITKPFHSKVLLARIENLLKQRQLLKNVFKGTASAEKEIEESHLEDRDKQFIKQLQQIIQQNLGNSEFGVEEIGKLIGLSRVQLYRKVKAMTGSSVVDLLRKARLAKAHRLLESRSMSISEVAYEVGFSAPSYFTKCFKDEYGILPGDVNS